MSVWKFISIIVLGLAWGGLVPGCSGSGSDHPPLLPVQGTVKLNGVPLSGARVQFLPKEGRSSAGITDSEGKYRLMYDAELPGTIGGEHQVTINFTEVVPGKKDDEGQPLTREVLPAEYNINSKLTATVDSSHVNFDWNLNAPKTTRP